MFWKRKQRKPDFVKVVYVARDKASELLARTLLDSAGINYIATNDIVQDMFGWGRVETGSNFIVGPVKFAVKSEDVENAANILAELYEIKPRPVPLWLRLFAIIFLSLTLISAIYSIFSLCKFP